MILNGSQIFVECLKELKVDTVFGYPGGAVLNLYDALYKEQKNIKHIKTSHEQGAAHAADGYARSTGKVGVCIATSGPGATNLVTGIATAYMDSVPMVAFTGQVGTALLGKDSFQEIDITGITSPITKHNYIVKDVTKLADVIREAFAIAKEGRPGPVLIDICKDVTAAECEFEHKDINDDFYIKHHKGIVHEKVSETVVEQAATLINNAKQPFIMAGGGVSIAKAHELLAQLARKARIPVTLTLMGLGAFPSTDPLYTGLIGMHGHKTSNLAVNQCDVLIVLGARFSDRVTSDQSTFAKQAKIIHIDVDPAEINKNVATDISIIGYMDDILKRLISKIDKKEETSWLKKVQMWKVKYPLAYIEDGFVKPQAVIKSFYKHTNGDAFVVTEVGQNQMWAAQWYKYKFPRQYISSGGLGTMGYGFGAAIGAKVGNPDKVVINFAGDGSFRMNLNELFTVVSYKIPIVIAILNNSALGMVKQWQDLFYDKRFSETVLDQEVDYAKIAQAFGAKGIKVEKPEDVEKAVIEALNTTDGPVVIDFKVSPTEMVYPIVPPGAAVDKLITE